MINTAKFPLELSHHDKLFGVVISKLINGGRWAGGRAGRHICDFLDSDYFGWEVLLLYI